MSSGDKAVWILLGINAVLAVLYLILKLNTKETDRPLIWIRFALFLLCPIAGFVYFFGSKWMKLHVFPGGDSNFLTKSETFEKMTVTAPDEVSDMNVVPLEEALIVSDKKDTRRLLLNVLKEGVDQSVSAVVLALSSEDSEASHYSASAIADVLSEFQDKFQKLTADIEQNPGRISAYTALIDYLLWFLPNGVLVDRELEMYINKAAEALNGLIELSPSSVNPKYFSDIVSLYISCNDLQNAKKWADEAEKICPETLEAYLSSMRADFALEDVDAFNNCLVRLKKSKIVIDKKTLDLIRTLS